MWIIRMKSGRSLKSDWSNQIKVFATEERAYAALRDLTYQSRNKSLDSWSVVPLF